MKHGAWKVSTKRVPKMATESGFRIIRVFSDKHNGERFRAHVDKLGRQFDRDRSHRKFRMRIRLERRKEKALYLAQQPDTGRGDGNHLAASIAAS